MKYYTIPPPAHLTDYVGFFWVFEGAGSTAAPYFHRTLANVCPELVFHYQGAFSELSANSRLSSIFETGLHAQTKHFRQFIVSKPFGMFGVYLYPQALSTLFGIPAIGFTDQRPELSVLLGKQENGLTERMLCAADNTERVAIITAFLEKRLQPFKRPEIRKAVNFILKKKGRVNIPQLALQCHSSLRQFERNFKEHAGFTPKKFARIARFYALTEEAAGSPLTLSQMAHHYGYFDQSHFIADFREFSGLSPKEWLYTVPHWT
ncbi:DUF6597 domain-containing transcriptional factor [Chitinophaga alhagiae]|uniref:DUF6597 domain-containing transcriptional factor n=1 Tax=Chitinophaga alhagiae TaxID=2203219 RepID=UPI000E5A5B50|nr:DUF6597 domain-containing transcriptional factor [Chitinophaga alhagiae]